MRSQLENIYGFLGWSFVQILFFSQVHLFGFITPFVYPMYLLLLPIRINNISLLLISFTQGLLLDLFSSSGGIHTASSVLVAFLRPLVLNAIMPGGKLDDVAKPSKNKLGLVSFLLYLGTLLFAHHLTFNFLDAYTFSDFFYTFSKSLLSALYALLLVLIYMQVLKEKN